MKVSVFILESELLNIYYSVNLPPDTVVKLIKEVNFLRKGLVSDEVIDNYIGALSLALKTLFNDMTGYSLKVEIDKDAMFPTGRILLFNRKSVRGYDAYLVVGTTELPKDADVVMLKIKCSDESPFRILEGEHLHGLIYDETDHDV
jgi:hypothetical protein